MTCEHTIPSDMGYGSGGTCSRIDISVLFDEGDKDWFAVIRDGSGESWVIDGARNFKKACKLVWEQYPAAVIFDDGDEPHHNICKGCGADLSDPEDGCGCPEGWEDETPPRRTERDMPSWDAGR